MVKRAFSELLLIAILPIGLLYTLYFSWGAAPLRFVGLLVVFAYVALATARRGYLASLWERPRWLWLLAALSCGLVALHVRSFVRDIRQGGECWTDMGRPSICAGEWLRRRMNPWAECAPKIKAKRHDRDDTYLACVKVDRCIDRKAGGPYRNWTHHGPGLDFMDGYKYGPVTALAYAPLVHAWRESGLFAVNLGFWLLEALALWLLAREAYPEQRAAPWRSVFVWLSPRLVPSSWFPNWHVDALWGSFDVEPPERDTFVMELTRRCANDVIPVALGLFALYSSRKRPVLAGVLLGLSLAAKPLPALLLCALLPGLAGLAKRRWATATLLTTIACYLPFFAWAPREMFANLVSFSVLRPSNSSSIRRYLPPAWESVGSLAQLLACAAIIALFYRARTRAADGGNDLAALLRAAALLTIAFVALNKIVHGNYLLWLAPLCALAIGGLPFKAQPTTPMKSPLETSTPA